MIFVYQPTEEELRSYLDPYENIICSERHQGEDDGLTRVMVGSFRKRRSSRTFPNDTFLGNRPSDLGLHHVMAQGESVFGNQQHLRSYMPNTMPSTGGEQLQHRVNAHLKNLSRQ
ncbi:hypothetical protein Bca52824_024567 [Brassica carinata]|uniref:Uncharacterized protein n=1 Tax=Brassica carinata TaxID=52824 RepID=A0A8X7VKF5_BRACI|nr:hypothetical protein Bca52824_024567 [Brassica carinata]